ncbi:unannotated protein [freshwater metagenome]|uniref:Unannotated protein n=1 Tax=freshwater metagenome TaxID=449393 RepID=A0A6J5YG58_9ZZZZ
MLQAEKKTTVRSRTQVSDGSSTATTCTSVSGEPLSDGGFQTV